ncbi:down syndrome cell adhesion molecule-like protein Dscam2 [Caerostris darwini]|uniref:Down syndrome cell adhesion molecule-like protein Dscam2 n=1 Tax=Caerostris darwini TaxID=1538125 RepID=A0AAV4MXF8_9ARAC|nr:down syndrome cell adhesion molecule-like protein Dscam2 [Caerostris darwini]
MGYTGPKGATNFNVARRKQSREHSTSISPFRTEIEVSPFTDADKNDLQDVVNQKYEIRLSDEFVLRGNMALLRCPIPSFVSDYVKVTSWERIDGFLITPGIISGKYGILQNGDLYIRDTTEHDSSYSFRCHTENSVTREKKVSTNYSKIIVTEPHHNQPPRIMRRSSRVSVPVGQKATLSCLAQGHPVPTYRWHKVAGELRSLPELGSSVRQEGGVLVFHKVVSADGGTYICEVSNSVGQDKVEAELIVEGKQ